MEEENKIPGISEETPEDKRAKKVREFRLESDIAADIPDAPAKSASTDGAVSVSPEPSAPASPAGETGENPSAVSTEDTDDPKAADRQETGGHGSGCLKKLLHAAVTVVLAMLVAFLVILYILDSSGLNKSDTLVDIEIPQGASTAQIADLLQENGLIDRPFCFRIYSKVSKADGKYQQGMFSLSADMGYSSIVEALQTTVPRKTVTVTIPEGYTVDKIAALLEEKEVCNKEEFYQAVVYENFDYDFVKAIPTDQDGEEYKGRIYRLEGYLFPDTYNFYVGSSGKTVVQRMLENFSNRIASYRTDIQNSGYTIDQIVILASIIQGEAANFSDMEGVSRVLANRMEPGSGFDKLQCDSTTHYVNSVLPQVEGISVTGSAYDTYTRQGLPVGAINNPGLDAIRAALNPSEDAKYTKAYFFATDYTTGITYFSNTYSQHVAICRKYRIGMYG